MFWRPHFLLPYQIKSKFKLAFGSFMNVITTILIAEQIRSNWKEDFKEWKAEARTHFRWGGHTGTKRGFSHLLMTLIIQVKLVEIAQECKREDLPDLFILLCSFLFCTINTKQYWKTCTVEPRFNDLWYNDIPGITIHNLLPTQQKLQ